MPPVSTVSFSFVKAPGPALVAFLHGLGLAVLVQLFASYGVEMRDLTLLSEDDLKELGVPLGQRRRIQHALS